MRTLAVMLMLGGVGADIVGHAPVPAAARRAEAPAPEEIPLLAWSNLADRPCRWLGRNVRVRVQVQAHPADWNPYLTRFGTGQFEALQGWADEQFPWVKTDFDAPQVRVFVRKGGAAARAVAGAKTYARFEMTGVVREVFLDLPWIEIVDARPMNDVVTEATVIHAARAVDLMNEHAWRLARLELDQALAAPLPDAASIEIERLRQVCVEAEPPGSADDDAGSDAPR
jgi:hypothetical protein